MASPPKLTLPGLAVLIVVALALAYFERGDTGGDGAAPPRESAGSPASPSSSAVPARANSNGDAGDFDYYALVLSWSPTHCASPEGQDDETQCARRDGRRYAFILHGLWPQYTRGYPENCPTRTRPYVPQTLIDSMMDIMPSKRLIIHEYRKHGTCSGLSPEGYYQTSRRLFQSVRIPDRFRNPAQDQFLDPGDVVRAFAAANPQLKPDMMAVSCRGPGSRFREIRICFSKTGEPRACGANESQSQLCRSSRMHVPPVRPSQAY